MGTPLQLCALMQLFLLPHNSYAYAIVVTIRNPNVNPIRDFTISLLVQSYCNICVVHCESKKLHHVIFAITVKQSSILIIFGTHILQ